MTTVDYGFQNEFAEQFATGIQFSLGTKLWQFYDYNGILIFSYWATTVQLYMCVRLPEPTPV